MEQLYYLSILIKTIVIGCVGYAAVNLLLWFLSLFGGTCLGC